MNRKAKMLGLVLSSVVAMSSLQYVSASDIEGHWAKELILEMQSKGVISGYEDGSFKPDATLTRAEFIKIVNRAFHFTGSSEQKFFDVKPEDWFASEVAIALSNGYLKGFPDGNFKPHTLISRAEAAVMIARVLKSEDDVQSAEKFSDSVNIPSWARGSIGALSKAGYFKGNSDGSFGAQKQMTRSEVLFSIKAASTDYFLKQEELKKLEEAKKLELEKKKEEEKKKKSQSKVIEKSGNLGSSDSLSSSDSDNLNNGGNSSNSGTQPAPNPPQQPQPSPQPQPPTPNPKPQPQPEQPPAPQPPVEKKVESISFEEKEYIISHDNGEVTIRVKYKPDDASDSQKGVIWTVTDGKRIIKEVERTPHSITFKALDDGPVQFTATSKSNKYIVKDGTIEIENQKVDLEEGSEGTPGSRIITNLEADSVYVLKEGDKYWSLDQDGHLVTQYDNQGRAELYTSILRSSQKSIIGLDNAKLYKVIKVELAENSLEKKIEEYKKMKKEDLNLKNFQAIEILGEEISNQFIEKERKLEEELKALGSDPQENKEEKARIQKQIDEIKKLQVEISVHRNSLKTKIQELLSQQEEKVKVINAQIDLIKKPLLADQAQDIIDTIDNNKKEISEIAWNVSVGVSPSNALKINSLRDDLEKHKALTDKKLILSDKGEITFAETDALVDWELKKETNEQVDSGKSLTSMIPNQLYVMRNNGVGEYKIEATIKFAYIEDLTKESNTKNVEFLNVNLGTVELDGTYHQKSGVNQSDKVKFDLEKKAFSWDKIEHATSYDVKAEISIETQGPNVIGIGGVYLDSSINDAEITNMENEFNKSSLSKYADYSNWYNAIGKNSARVFAEVGLTENSISLDKLVPCYCDGDYYLKPQEFFEGSVSSDKITFKLWIIPRNEGSLYVTDMKNLIGSGKLFEKNSAIAPALLITDFKFSDMMEKFGIIKK